ncbi:hypothetical protein D3C76_766060 [compost metagenome]
MIEWCWISIIRRLPIADAVPVIFSQEQFTIYIPTNFSRLPLNRIRMVLLNRRSFREHILFAGIYIIRPFATVMNGTRYRIRATAPAFHNIKLTRGSPIPVLIVLRQHPDCWPIPFSGRCLSPNLKFPIFFAEKTFRFKP